MKRRPILAVLTFAAAGLSPALAQEATPAPPQNAAVEYWRASYAALAHSSGQEGGLGLLGDIDWEAIGPNLDPDKMPEEYKKAAACISPEAVSDFLIASERELCDFQNPVENGPATLLPHLGALRSLARIVRYDAREKLMAGDADAAAERLAAIYRAADHVTRDQIMISSLVAAAISVLASDEMDTLISTRTLTARGRDELLAALQALDAKDPYNMIGAIRGEQRLMLGWVRANYTGGDAALRFVREVAPLVTSVEGPDDKLIEVIAMMREEQFRESLAQVDRFYADILEAWQSDVTLSRLATIETRVKSGDYGPVTALIGPALQQAYRSSMKALARRDEDLLKLMSYLPPAPAAAPQK